MFRQTCSSYYSLKCLFQSYFKRQVCAFRALCPFLYRNLDPKITEGRSKLFTNLSVSATCFPINVKMQALPSSSMLVYIFCNFVLCMNIRAHRVFFIIITITEYSTTSCGMSLENYSCIHSILTLSNKYHYCRMTLLVCFMLQPPLFYMKLRINEDACMHTNAKYNTQHFQNHVCRHM